MAWNCHFMSIFYPQGLMYFNTKLKVLEKRQQQIRDLRAKHNFLKEELEDTKSRLMMDPSKWVGECKYYIFTLVWTH